VVTTTTLTGANQLHHHQHTMLPTLSLYKLDAHLVAQPTHYIKINTKQYVCTMHIYYTNYTILCQIKNTIKTYRDNLDSSLYGDLSSQSLGYGSENSNL